MLPRSRSRRTPHVQLRHHTAYGILPRDTQGGGNVRAKLQKWGNGLGLRVPKALARSARLREGGEVELTVQDGRLVITPVEEDLSLEEMLDQVTEENRHGLIDWGPAVGKEAW